MRTSPISRRTVARRFIAERWKRACLSTLVAVAVVLVLLWIERATRTASSIERAWTAIAALGVLMTVWMIVDAWLDWYAVQRGIRGGYAVAYGPRWWIALGALVGNGLTGFVWLGFFAVGVIAMQFPPPPPSPDQTVSNQIAGWVLIAMEGVLAAAQVWSRIVRLKVGALAHVHEPELPS